MPREIEMDCHESWGLADFAEAQQNLHFTPDCDASLAQASLMLRRLNNNRHFLGDMLIEFLKPGYSGPIVDSGFSPQALVLSPLIHGSFLRANIWPSTHDHCYQSSGAASFVYGLPHDHNFSFLTVGYFGPGYGSDYYEYDYAQTAGYVGEPVNLRFTQRSQLHQDRMMLYRAHRDVHSQLPPESLSVSLNLVHIDPAQPWLDQYAFDLEKQQIGRMLSPNSTEVFLRIAVGSGNGNAIDLAEEFGKSHPSSRIRLASFEARAQIARDVDEMDRLWRKAENSGCRMLRMAARRARHGLMQD